MVKSNFIRTGSEDLELAFRMVLADERNLIMRLTVDVENFVPATMQTPRYLYSCTDSRTSPYILKHGGREQEPNVITLHFKGLYVRHQKLPYDSHASSSD